MNQEITNSEIKTLLKWQLDMGVDETISNTPISLVSKSEQLRSSRLKALGVKALGIREQEPEIKINNQPSTNHQPSTISHQRISDDYQPTADFQQPITKNQLSEPASFYNPAPTFKPIIMPANPAIAKPNSEWLETARKLADKAKTIVELRAAVENFDGLSIKKTANKCVFAEGAEDAPIMLIGEAPGENEDTQGRPFCGVSGRLLDEIFKHIGHTRAENLYITNSIFWRPPGNRRPTDEEIEMCRPFVEKHIALIDPKVLVLVGATSAASVLQSKESISTLRKTSQIYKCNYTQKDFTVRCIYHPSYLLRQPSQKKTSWFDALEIKRLLTDN
jgi:uracil-DNA glycosylase